MRAKQPGKTLEISRLLSPEELRAAAKKAATGRASGRMLAIAHALEGKTRTEAARLAGMTAQTLKDAIDRYNTEGLAGLYDRPRSGCPCKLNESQREELAKIIVAGPDIEKDGYSGYTLDDLVAIVREKFQVSYHPERLSILLKTRMKISRQKARPIHPKTDLASQEAFKKMAGAARQDCIYTSG